MVDVSGDFLKNINSNFGVISPIQKPAEGRPVNAYENNLNLTMELQKLVNEHLRMEEYAAAPEGEADNQPFDMPMDFLGDAPEAGEFHGMFNDFGDLGIDELAGSEKIVPKKVQKKQVQQIRLAMMKLDKKTQRAAVRGGAA